MKLVILAFLFTTISFGQNLEGKYSGYWADTSWDYTFDVKGNYEYVTAGHFGFTNSKGKYTIKSDTLILNTNSGAKYSVEIHDYKMLIDRDSCIIDISTRYDFCKVRKTIDEGSNRRNIKYPQVKTDNKRLKAEMEEILLLAFSFPKVTAFYHFNTVSQNLVVKEYYQLNEDLVLPFKIDDRYVNFVKEPLGDFYIEITDINLGQYSNINFNIPSEGMFCDLWFAKENGKWKIISENIYERKH